MNYINAFNNELKQLAKAMPQNETIQVIHRYMDKCRERNYYMALDYLGQKLGMEYQVIQVCDLDKDRVVGHIPAIKFHPGNEFNSTGEVWVKELRHEPMPSQRRCYAFVAKEFVYWLMRLKDLERLALADWREQEA